MTRIAPFSHSSTEKAQALYVGVDEAGYGPNLGPLVVCSVAFTGPTTLNDVCWWKLLCPAVTRDTAGTGLHVDDSKRVLACRDGRQRLQRTVLAFLGELGCTRFDIGGLIGTLDPDRQSHLTAEHWYAPDWDARNDGIVDAHLRAKLAARGLQLHSIRVRILFPAEFNQLLVTQENKAAVELVAIRELLAPYLSPEQACDSFITVDRLGGRRYYRTVLEDLAGDAFLQTLQEDRASSIYTFAESTRETMIRFEVQADARYLSVALASMIAKYIRERCMEQFNAFWQARIPGLAPTAGYPGDAKRFFTAVADHLQVLGIPQNAVWRER